MNVRPHGRALVVAATAAAIAALVGSVGGPSDGGAPTGAGVETTSTSSPGLAVGRDRLSRWCQDVLAAPDAVAVVSDRSWRCVGRAGGIWRREPLLGPDLCRQLGYRGESTATTDEAIVCLA